MTIRVLYLHHYPILGGASRSLWEMIESFPKDAVLPRLVVPRGQFAAMLRERGFEVLETSGVSLFDNTRATRYRGWRWVILLREILNFPATVFGLLKARRHWPDTDVVHANEATMLASVILARWLFKKPVIVHVRSVMSDAPGWRTRFMHWVLWRVATRVIAIDESVRRSLPSAHPVHVIHNGLRLREDVTVREHAESGGSAPMVVAMVGNLLRVKGCLDFVEAAAICKRRGLPVVFRFIGQSARPTKGLLFRLARLVAVSQEVEPELRARIEEHGIGEMVQFAGFNADLAVVYRSMDVICFPSHYDAPGRPIFEAALFGIPSIAAISAPLPDTIIDGVTGIAIPPRNPLRLADAVQTLLENRELRLQLGRNARAFAVERFDAGANAAKVLQLYDAFLNPPLTDAGAGRPSVERPSH
jgi:glycosyltransferase involved in cell wall biosynthesis